jgi:hypothetical protein
MSKTLAIATTAGLLLCALFLGLAVLIGGDDIFHDARSLKEVKPLIDLATHKTWRWGGGDTLALDAPLNIRYRPSDPPGVLVSGPEELLKHVRVSDGRIAADTNALRRSGKRLDAVVSGVSIRKFVVNGGENLDLGKIDQPGLDLHINGNGTVSGSGKVARLNLVIAGSGTAELGGLSVGDARISLLGSGSATLSPHGEVQLFIAGSGKLGLLTHPAHLRQTILGSGEVNQIAAEAVAAAMKSSQERVRQALQQAIPQPPIPPQPPMPDNIQTNGGVMVRGNHDTDLGRIDQESLNVTIADSGSVTAEGKVENLKISIMGSGHARLGKVTARNATVMLMGSGSATVAPSDELKVTIMGSGDVHLLTRPAQIKRTIMGSGRIIEEH